MPTSVAPRAGAWIETNSLGKIFFFAMSPPARGRGLKLSAYSKLEVSASVAPRAGAWIETLHHFANTFLAYVAPRAGAWIETTKPIPTTEKIARRPPRGGVD